MLELEFDDVPLEIAVPDQIDLNGLYPGMPMVDYRVAEGLANSELQVFDRNPSSYIWVNNAPSDPLKVGAPDFGTALHSSLLEPETYEDSVLVSPTKGRSTAGFVEFQSKHSDKLVLTEVEYDQIKLMTESAKCDPMFNKALNAKGVCESSIFVTDPTTGLQLKIRPDKIILTGEQPLFADVKSTADIEDWRQDKQWLNPLFKFRYGFTAAYYLHVGSMHYQTELDRYAFLVVSKSSVMGKYPVTVFIITKEELVEYGFWQEMLDALAKFAECKKTDNFMSYEKFPQFNIFNEEDIVINEVD